MCTDDGARDSESEPQPTRLRREERLEYSLEMILGDALTAIDYGNTDHIRLISMGQRDLHPAIAGTIAAHRFARVKNKVKQHLLKFYAGAQYRPPFGLYAQVYMNVSFFQCSSTECQHAPQYIDNFHALHLQLAATQHRAQTLNYFAGMFVVANYLSEDFAQCFEVEVCFRRKKLRGLCVTQYRRQWLLQLVRECTGKLSQHSNARQMSNLPLLVEGLDLGFFAMSGINDTAHHSYDRP